MKSVPVSQRTNLKFARTESGTIVVWKKCDRIEIKNEKVFLMKIRKAMGRLFRKPLWSGRKIIIGGEKVVPFDPLYLIGEDAEKAVPFGSELEYEISIPMVRKKLRPLRFDSSNCRSKIGTIYRTSKNKRKAFRRTPAFRSSAQDARSITVGSLPVKNERKITMTGGAAKFASNRNWTSFSA